MGMKNTITKKIVLWGGLVGIALFILLGFAEEKFGMDCSYQTNKIDSDVGAFIPGGNGERYPDVVYHVKADWCEPLFSTLPIFLPLLLLSLITYKMREEVFRAWWNFARWWVPIIIAVTYLLNNANNASTGGSINAGQDFTILVLSLFYIILVTVSLWRIIAKYRQLKREGK